MTPKSQSASRLVVNSSWNLLGLTAGLVSAFIAIPILIGNLGNERFGLLAICYSVIGYLGLFDLGIGRALTYLVSKYEALGNREETEGAIATALTLLLLLACLMAAAVLAVRGPLVRYVEGLNRFPAGEMMDSVTLLAVTIPVVMLSTALRGILEGLQEFAKINAIIVPSAVLLYAGPAAASLSCHALPYLLAIILGIRIIALLQLASACRTRGVRLIQLRASRSRVQDILQFGGWMTVSNIVSPLMVNMDRMVIGLKLPLASVAYYVTPFEIVYRTLAIPNAVANASFPEFAKLTATPEKKKYATTFSAGSSWLRF